MGIKIALVGNPNCGKTTLFNVLTGSNQFVGNWPGVTVEKKEGTLRENKEVVLTDLPGVYSLSPYTLEEVVARNYLMQERPDVILNIVDGTNLERNLYLTTQLSELGIPIVVAINMMDLVEKRGDRIDLSKLSARLSCPVVAVSALKEEGLSEAVQLSIQEAAKKVKIPFHCFGGVAEHALAHIEEATVHHMERHLQRWYAIKIFERDAKVIEELAISEEILSHIEEDIKAAEAELDDDAESIITNERYVYIASVLDGVLFRKNAAGLTVSDRIDRIVTNRFLAFPIFVAVMFLVYYISVTTVGTWLTDFTNDGLFGEGFHLFGLENLWIPGIPVLVTNFLSSVGTANWLQSLLVDGIIGGVGAVLGFVPQILVLFFFLSFFEACGYMSRVAFVMDRIFRKFGLSGKSFIPMLIGTGCSVPGIMASRTIENERDRRMTIITTSFIPCGAKLPIIAMISTAFFDGAFWVAPLAFFVGIVAVMVSGILLKKTRLFAGEPAPFVMELPAYHWPSMRNILRNVWDKGFSFVKKAGSVILLASIVIWLGSVFGVVDGKPVFDTAMELEDSVLGSIGGAVSFLFAPLGFGNAKAVVATLMGLVAKEEVVGVFGVLDFGDMTKTAAFSFLFFNLLCAPCFAAIGAIRREMNSAKWTWFAIGYQCVFAYAVSLMVYQFGMLFAGSVNVAGLIVAAATLVILLFLLCRRPSKGVKCK